MTAAVLVSESLSSAVFVPTLVAEQLVVRIISLIVAPTTLRRHAAMEQLRGSPVIGIMLSRRRAHSVLLRGEYWRLTELTLA